MSKISIQKLLVIAFLVLANGVFAQIQHGGEPYQWKDKKVDLSTINFIETAVLNMDEVQAEDAVTDQYKETPYRFGMDTEVNYNFFTEGTLEVLSNGDKLWRLGIHCPEATSINFIFGEYDLPEGATVFIWSTDRNEFIGSLTNQNNKGFNKLAVGLVHNDRIVIEYREPANVVKEAKLSLENITHGYRPVINKWKEDKGPFGNSGTCNMNVNCEDGDPWQDDKRGVALIISNGNAHCTGSLINNTNEDGTPYFLTAAHCDADESNWIFYFNHEYDGCPDSGSAPINQSLSGATQLASTSPSDAHLILLSSDVPADYNPYFCGWDNSGDPVQLGVGIHHPAGDVKKISFDDDPLTITQYFTNTPGNFDHWRIEAWERETTTEPGSSGSPLFDQDHRIIGQLHGGTAACGNSIDDYYGAFHISFPFFSQYLDPSNSGVATLDGFGPFDIVYANDVQALGINNIPNFSCSVFAFDPVFELRNNGTETLTAATINYSYNGIAQSSEAWTGSLAQNETVEIILATFTPSAETNSIEISVVSSTDDNMNNNTTNISFSGESSAAQGVGEINVYILPDDYGAEITWDLKDPEGNTVLSGGPYTNEDLTPIEESYTVPYGTTGCYEFVIEDGAGDGICCGYGIGNYEITDGDGTVIAEGAEYDSGESKLLSMVAEGVSIDEAVFVNQITIFPNPANDFLLIDVNQILGDYQLNVINIMGQTIITKENVKGNNRLDIESLTSGVYFIEVKTKEGTKTEKVVVR